MINRMVGPANMDSASSPQVDSANSPQVGSTSSLQAGSASPLQTGDVLYFMRVMLFITLLCMGYSLSKSTPAGNKEPVPLLPATTGAVSPEQEWAGLPSWQRKASEKAIEKYTVTQEKKWRRWNDAMFERSD